MRSRGGARTLVVALLGVLWMLGAAPAAEAHLRAQEATNLQNRIVSEPSIPGVRWWLGESGRRLGLEFAGPDELVVLGHEAEPYLRFVADGVYANVRSPATYLNTRPDVDPALPPVVDPAGPPEWIRISAEPRYVWYDRRVGWTGPDLDPGAVRAWGVEVVWDGRTATLAGELRWVAGPPPWRPPLAGLIVVAAVLGMAVRRGRDAALRASAFVVGAVALLNVVHLVDELATRPVLSLDAATGFGHTALFVGAGFAAAWWSLRRPGGSRWVLAAGSVAVLLHQGLLQLPMLWSSTIPTIWSEDLVRYLVGLSLAQAPAVLATLAVAGSPSSPGVRVPHGWQRSPMPV